jgi:hypothetical protein
VAGHNGESEHKRDDVRRLVDGALWPLAFPGALERARQHSWAWRPARDAGRDHRGFLRLRTSYVFGGNDDAPVFPAKYDPLAELVFLSRLTAALSDALGVICYFNPNGEVLRDGATFERTWDAASTQGKTPLLLWMNVRFFRLGLGFAFMDTVGNGQLDVPDVEAVFPVNRYAPSDVGYYLRNVTHYLLGLGREVGSGEPIDGPGEGDLRWTTDVLEERLVQPPRRVLRLFPKDDRDAVQAALRQAGK